MAARIRLAALALAIAGVLFLLYPALRPFSDEASLQGAAAFASGAWIAAHTFAMVGFILVALGSLGLYFVLARTASEPVAFLGTVVVSIGAGLTLPFYGAEAFGLHAIGAEALARQDPSLLRIVDQVRSGPGLIVFLLGLAGIGVGAAVEAVAVWRSRVLSRWSGVPLALGFLLFIPQFFLTQPLRVAHGALLMAGCVWLAVGMWSSASALERNGAADAAGGRSR
jgi:hypothetical protein